METVLKDKNNKPQFITQSVNLEISFYQVPELKHLFPPKAPSSIIARCDK